MSKIGIIGTGKFGYSFGKILLKEYEVIFSDKNDKVVKTLSKEINITGNNTLLIENSDVIFVCVDTPITNDKEYNTIQISHIVDDFIECFKNEVSINGKTLIITSTVNPYTTKVVQERLSAYGVQVAYLPTFIEYTNITNEILNTSFLLLGNSNHEITSLISNIFTKVLDTPVRIQQMGYTSSELTKIMIDCFSTVQKTFVNTFKDMFDNMSLSHEFTMASDTLNKDFKKGNSFISNGRPFDGPNISNVNFVVTNLLEQQELSGELFNTVTEINNSRIDNIVIKYTKENPNKEIPFIIDGITYLKDSNIVSNSSSIDLCSKLLELGYSINIIESDNVIRQMSLSFNDSYPDKVKFLKKGLNPEGYKIKF